MHCVIIAGSRDFSPGVAVVHEAVRSSGFIPMRVVSGCATGVDTDGELWAIWSGVPTVRFPADWHLFGRRAGPKRNIQMAQYAVRRFGRVITIYRSGRLGPGTRHMMQTAARFKLPLYEHVCP